MTLPSFGHDPTVRDTLLVSKALAGNSDAFAQLVGFYQKKVWILGKSFFKNETDADDFVQDVFIKVYTSLNTFRGEARFSTWLMRIAYNMAINSIKRRKEYTSLTENIEILDTDYGPEERLLRDITAQAIRTALSELPQRFGICLDLYFFYDISYEEIGVITDLPVNTVKSHIFRAKKLLKEKLEDYV